MGDIIILAIISIAGKLIEDGRKIALSRGVSRRLKNVHGLYEVFNFHLAASLPVCAYLLAKSIHDYYFLCVVGLVILGIALKCAFSHHKPERLRWADSDARWGMIIPNGCAIAAIIVGLWATSPTPSWIGGDKSDVPDAHRQTTQSVTNMSNP